MGLHGPGGYWMETWINICVNTLDQLWNGCATREPRHPAWGAGNRGMIKGFQGRDHLLLALQTISNILRELCLRVGNIRTMSRHDLCDIYLLQALERVEILLHITLWWDNDDSAHTCNQVTSKKYTLPLQQIAEVIK